jgi:hypothetical protein
VSSFANEVTVCTPDKIKFGREDDEGGTGGGGGTVLLPSTRHIGRKWRTITTRLLLLLLFDFSALCYNSQTSEVVSYVSGGSVAETGISFQPIARCFAHN